MKLKYKVILFLISICWIGSTIHGKNIHSNDRLGKRDEDVEKDRKEKRKIEFFHDEFEDVFYLNHKKCQQESDGSNYYNSIMETCNSCEEPSSDPRQFFYVPNCIIQNDFQSYFDEETHICRSCNECEEGNNCKIQCRGRRKSSNSSPINTSSSFYHNLIYINMSLNIIIIIFMVIYVVRTQLNGKRKCSKNNKSNLNSEKSISTDEESSPFNSPSPSIDSL